jgi:hypothetical protein
MIDHVNLRNFFINKIFNRKKTRWWKRLAEFDLKIKYRFDKNNFANDSFRKRNYENETANENKNNENLNLRKWILIESKSTFTSKNEKKKNSYFFQSTSHRQFALSSADAIRQKLWKQSTKNRKAIVSRAIISRLAQKFQSLKTHKTSWRRRKSLRLWKKFWRKRNFSSHRFETSKRIRKNFDSKTSRIAKILLRKIE